jgi:hypothetical protein
MKSNKKKIFFLVIIGIVYELIITATFQFGQSNFYSLLGGIMEKDPEPESILVEYKYHY